MRRTKKEALETREAILDAAEQAFLEKGVSRTSLNDIAKRALVTRGAIYFHFADKLAIYYALIERIRFPQEQVIEQVQKNDGVNPIDILEESVIASIFRFSKDERQQRVLTIITLRCEYVDEFSEIIARIRQAHNSMFGLFERMFLVANDRNMLADDWTPEMAARALVTTFRATLNEFLHAGKSFDLNVFGNKIIKTQISAFRK